MDKADLNEVLETKPEILVVGTGYYGRMKVPKETNRIPYELRDRSIRLADQRSLRKIQRDARIKEGSSYAAFDLLKRCLMRTPVLLTTARLRGLKEETPVCGVE